MRVRKHMPADHAAPRCGAWGTALKVVAVHGERGAAAGSGVGRHMNA